MREKVIKFDSGKVNRELLKKFKDRDTDVEPYEARDEVVKMVAKWYEDHPNAKILKRGSGIAGDDLVFTIWYREERK